MNFRSHLAMRHWFRRAAAAALIAFLLLAALPASPSSANSIHAVSLLDSGWLAPAAYTNYGWTAPQKGLVSDDQYASCRCSGLGVLYRDFTFPDLPAGAEISGIEVSVEGFQSGRGRLKVFLVKDDDQVTTGIGTKLPGKDSITLFGSETEKWGTTWKPADFRSDPVADVAVKLKVEGECTTVSVDQVRIKLYYSLTGFTLTYLAGPNGSISGETPQSVPPGGSGTPVTAVPATGYRFVNWSDGRTDNPRTDTDVKADITVTANFAADAFTLTYLAGAGGTISGPTPQTVPPGGDGQPVTAVPNTGFAFLMWSDNSTANPRTDTNVTADLTVTAQFVELVSFEDWTGGVAITSDKPIIGVVRPHMGDEVTSYTAIAGGGPTAYIPMLFKKSFDGTYDAAFFVQNLDHTTAASLTLRFYDSAGSLSCTLTDTLPPAASKGWWVPALTCLPAGWVGGAVITSNTDIATVARPHVGAEMTSYNGFNAGSLTSFLPMLFKSIWTDYNAAFYIQNVGAAEAHITITFRDNTGATACTLTDSLAPLASKGWWVRSLGCLPSTWVGGVVVNSDQPVVSIARPHVGNQVATYSGLPGGTPTAYLPMVFKTAFDGTYVGAFYVQNTDTNTTANLTLRFYDSAGTLTCTMTDTLAPLASKGWWTPHLTCLPAGWVGSVVASADTGITAAARPHIGEQVMAYPGAAEASTSLFLPMLFRNAVNATYNSAFYIQNTDASGPATVTLRFYDETGGLACQRSDTIPPLASFGYWLASVVCE